MNRDLFYTISLSLVPNIGNVAGRQLLDHFGNAEAVFHAKKDSLEKIDGIGSFRAAAIKKFKDFHRAEEELAFIDKYKISAFTCKDKSYPQRLLNCYDAPLIVYFKGNANLNTSRTIAVIGTRKHSDYGKEITEKLIKDLSTFNVLVCSGLAYGIDAIAHKAALKNNLQTVGVLAHGLDRIYPFEHQELARQMTQHGGLLTDFISYTKPDKHNFPQRNRIVAGISDCTVVIETDMKGGSLITAELADNYNRDVFAYPGRINDKKSTGCNYLIKQNKAALITSAEDIIECLRWTDTKPKKKQQKELFIALTEEEKILTDLVKEKENIHIDELYFRSGLSTSKVAAAILNLELNNVLECLPGKMYRLL
jgi:DNA processing protein